MMKTGNKVLLMLCLLVLLAAAGCASSKWALESDASEKQLYWMEEPGSARVKHFMSIKGFGETNSSIQTFLFGRGKSTLERPVAVASGSDGRFAIADTGSRCVHYYIPAEGRYLRLASLASTQLLSPVSVIFDDEMRLYISDSALGKIFVVDKQGSYLFSISASDEGPLKRPTGLAWDSDKKLLFAVDT